MLSVKNLCKSYRSFGLKNVSFDLPKGYILGFIGQNGAGKTTTIKCITGINRFDAGEVTLCGEKMPDNLLSVRQNVGYSMGRMDCFPHEKVSRVAKVYASFFKKFDWEIFNRYLKIFGIDSEKKVRELSEGMKVKLDLALALSHGAKLLILDEPTSGLDPVAREEVLDILQKIVSDGEHSILFSTHITSDLDRCADYIVMISDGEVRLWDTKDNIIDNHIILSAGKDRLNEIREKAIGIKENNFGFQALVKKEDNPGGFLEERPDLEDILVFYSKKEIVL